MDGFIKVLSIGSSLSVMTMLNSRRIALCAVGVATIVVGAVPAVSASAPQPHSPARVSLAVARKGAIADLPRKYTSKKPVKAKRCPPNSTAVYNGDGSLRYCSKGRPVSP